MALFMTRPNLSGCRKVRLQQSQGRNAIQLARDQAVADVSATARIGNGDARGAMIGLITRLAHAGANAWDHHGPAVGAGRDQLAVLQADLAVMKVTAFVIVYSVENDRQSDRLADHGARIGKRRRRHHYAGSKAG